MKRKAPARQKVLVIAATLGTRGGLELRTRRNISALAERADVTVIAWERRIFPQVRHDILPARTILLPSIIAWYGRQPMWMQRADTLLRFVTGTVTALLVRRNYSAIYAGGLHPYGMIAAVAGRLLGRPFVADTSLGGTGGDADRFEKSLAPKRVKRLLWRGTILTESPSIRTELLNYGCPAGSVVDGTLGVDTETLAPASNEQKTEAKIKLGLDNSRVVLCLARFDLREKRIDLLLEAWRRASSRDARLLIAGDGPDRRGIECLAEQAGPRVKICGWLDDVRPLLMAADAAVLPTMREGGSNFLHEAAASGVPSWLSGIDVLRALAPGGASFVDNTVPAWASAIEEIVRLGEDDLRKRGEAARSWAEPRSLTASIERLRDLLGL